MMRNESKNVGSTVRLAPEPETELSVLISISELKRGYFKTEIKANKEQLTKLAKRFGLIELKRFDAILEATLLSTEPRVLVEGSFRARVVQQCVVTLEPVSNEVKGILYCKYAVSPEINETGPIDFDLTTEDPPEMIVDNQFDAGVILTEQLGLELNPFPRSLGGCFDAQTNFAHDNEPSKRTRNPFDVLKKLK